MHDPKVLSGEGKKKMWAAWELSVVNLEEQFAYSWI